MRIAQAVAIITASAGLAMALPHIKRPAWWRNRHGRWWWPAGCTCGPRGVHNVEVSPFLVECPHGRRWRAFIDPLDQGIWWQAWD